MLSSIARFGDDTAGLEKTLRLLQNLCIVAIGLLGPTAPADQTEALVQARTQFMIGRRYFRLLKWHPCWHTAYQAMNREQTPVRKALEVAKWTFLGTYFFIEMFTITNAMRVTDFTWGPRVQLEANKHWFYALVAAVLLSLYDLAGVWFAAASKSAVKQSEKDPSERSKKNNEKDPSESTRESDIARVRKKLYAQLVIDGCDLFIPGSAVGWLPVHPVMVGTCGTISSIVAGRQIWERVQRGKT